MLDKQITIQQISTGIKRSGYVIKEDETGYTIKLKDRGRKEFCFIPRDSKIVKVEKHY